MARPLEKSCAWLHKQSHVWRTSRKRWKSLSRFPTKICVNVVASGQAKCVALAGCFYAIFMSGYQEEARLWDDAYYGWWDDAGKGNSALQSGLLRRIYEKFYTLDGRPSVCLFFELEKFFDCGCLHKLIGLALERQFTVRLASASVSSVQEMCWIKACSLPAESWLVALRDTGLSGWYCTAFWSAPAETRHFVDDLTTMAVANSEDDVTDTLCSVALELRDGFEHGKLTLSKSKSMIVSNRNGLAKRVQRNLKVNDSTFQWRTREHRCGGRRLKTTQSPKPKVSRSKTSRKKGESGGTENRKAIKLYTTSFGFPSGLEWSNTDCHPQT